MRLDLGVCTLIFIIVPQTLFGQTVCISLSCLWIFVCWLFIYMELLCCILKTHFLRKMDNLHKIFCFSPWPFQVDFVKISNYGCNSKINKNSHWQGVRKLCRFVQGICFYSLDIYAVIPSLYTYVDSFLISGCVRWNYWS